MICFQEGCGSVWLGGQTFAPRAGSVLIYRPGQPHREMSDEHAPQHTVYLEIDRAEWIERPESHLWDQTGSIRWLSRSLWAEVRHHPAGVRSDLAQAYLQALAIQLARAPAAQTGALPPLDWRIEARRYIEEHFSDPTLDRERIARAVGVGVSTLAHGFGRKYGLSVRAYVEELRLREAAQRLREGGAAVQDIAAAVGYPDPFYFSRVFRCRYGVPPSEFRQPAKS